MPAGGYGQCGGLHMVARDLGKTARLRAYSSTDGSKNILWWLIFAARDALLLVRYLVKRRRILCTITP